jgi:pilus assembly protein CpaB
MVTGENIAEQIRGRKTLLLALTGGVLGVAASVMAYHYLEREEAQFREQVMAKQSQNEVLVVVAKADLAAGSEIGENNMATRHVPKDYVYPETVLPGSFDSVRGQVLSKGLAKGQPLLSSYLAGGGVTGLSDKVKDGRRAVTINVDEVSSINGMIHPGDRIDLLFSSRASAGGGAVVPLLQNVRVLATGSQFAPASDQPGKDKFGLSYGTLTLDVSPEEATRITLAREIGILTALLRGRGDEQSGLPATPLTPNLLFGSPGAAPPSAAPSGISGPAAARIDTVTYIVRGDTPGVATVFELPVGDVPSRALAPLGNGGKYTTPPTGSGDQATNRGAAKGMEKR